ncbi:MAG: TRAP transporter small permease subunit [Pseudomonadota bacterium]
MTDPPPFQRLIVPVVRWAAILCGYGLLLFALATGAEIIGRKVFAFSLLGVDEFGGYMLAIMSAVGFSYTLLQRGHTRIDIFMRPLPARMQAALNLLAALSLAGYAVFMVWRGWFVLGESIEFKSISGTPLQTPLWQPQGIWEIGLVLFAAIACLLAGHAVVLMFRDSRRLNALYGPPTIREEIEAELGPERVRATKGGSAP